MPNLEKANASITVEAPARSWFQVYAALLDALRRPMASQIIRVNVQTIVKQIGRKFVEEGFFTPEELERVEKKESEAGALGSAFDNLIWPTFDTFIWPTPGS